MKPFARGSSLRSRLTARLENARLPGFEDEPESPRATGPVLKASVLFPLPLPEPFDYRIPEGLKASPGDHVLAPIGARLVRGCVWAVSQSPTADNLKPIAEILPGPPLPEETRRFLDWAAKFLVASPGKILSMVVRSEEALRDPTFTVVYAPSGGAVGKITEARARVLSEAAKEAVAPAELARRARVSAGVVKGLIETGALVGIRRLDDPPFPNLDLRRAGRALSPTQRDAAAVLIRAVEKKEFAPILLDGVTGSGKTEVYLEAVAAALALEPDAQALVLLPEIALTQAVLARFQERFGAAPVEWHSAIGQRARRRAWREVAAGRARLVVGARSALFLPFPNLKLIVIDEEHDGSYKQDDGVAYHARDLSVARAKLGGCAIVMASATPSLETLMNAKSGRYEHVVLKARHGAALLPAIELVDLRETPPEKGKWLSPKLAVAAAEALANGEQALFYINRRGYAPLTLCRACGHRMVSPDTESWLVEHRYSGRLVCHVTGFSMPRPKECPHCLACDSFVAIGPGVERVEEEVRDLFPQARVEIFSSDTAPDGESVRALVNRMAAGEIDILIGTQIVPKGHNFPTLTLVGVVDADAGLRGGDLRAGERSFQLLLQVAGRAGRADKPGRAIIQTYAPESPAIALLVAGDRDAFIAHELDQRRIVGFPPFGRLGAVILSAPSAEQVDEAARLLGENQPNAAGVDVWGPAPAPITILRGRHRRRFLIRSDRNVDLSAFLAAWKERVKLASAVRIAIDVEPYSFM